MLSPRYKYIIFCFTVLLYTNVILGSQDITVSRIKERVSFYAEVQQPGAIAYNGDFFLYVASRGEGIYKSYDGYEWEKIKNSTMNGYEIVYFNSPIRRMIWNGEQFVAIGSEEIFTSSDGERWDKLDVKDSNGNDLRFNFIDMAYRNGMYSFVGSKVPKDVWENGGMYIADAAYSYSHDLKVFYDGTSTNNAQHIAGSRYPNNLIVGKDKIIGVVGYGTVMSSEDGKKWVGIKSDKDADAEALAGGRGIWDGKKFVSAYNDKIAYSFDGIKWKLALSQPDVDLGLVAYNGREYIAAGKPYYYSTNKKLTYYYSTDGIKWTKKSTDYNYDIVSTAIGTSNGFILAGNDLWYVETRVVPKVYISNKKVSFNSDTGYPYVEDNNVYVPMRKIVELLGYKLNWLQSKKTIIISDDKNEVQFYPSNNKVIVNNKETLDNKYFKEVDSITYISLGAIKNIFNENVEWDNFKKEVTIN